MKQCSCLHKVKPSNQKQQKYVKLNVFKRKLRTKTKKSYRFLFFAHRLPSPTIARALYVVSGMFYCLTSSAVGHKRRNCFQNATLQVILNCLKGLNCRVGRVLREKQNFFGRKKSSEKIHFFHIFLKL